MNIHTSPTAKTIASFVARHRPANRSPQVDRTPALCSMTADLGPAIDPATEVRRLSAENKALRERVESLERECKRLQAVELESLFDQAP